jgi:hypothetical protein
MISNDWCADTGFKLDNGCIVYGQACKLDNGCIVYGQACKSYSKLLHIIHRRGIRLELHNISS